MDSDAPRHLEPWSHSHRFLGAHHQRHERRTRWVVVLSLIVMVVETAGGLVFHSMALIADGLHMSTHAGALFVAASAYAFARSRADDPRFTFGTGKMGDLAAFASGVGLVMMALLIAFESAERLLHPAAVAFAEAAAVAALGLVVSLVSAILLRHAHAADGADAGRDLNIWAARLHMLTDVFTSALTVAALLIGLWLGWAWLDPATGLLGAAVVGGFAWRLIRDAGAVLLDVVPDVGLGAAIRARLETADDRVEDLHVWRLGPGHLGVIVAVSSAQPQNPEAYRARLQGLGPLSHVTVEATARPS